MYFPSHDQFLALAKEHNTIPVTRTVLADFETPLSAYQKIKGQAESFLFESVEGGEHLGRYSFVGCNPRAVIQQKGAQVELREAGRLVEQFQIVPDPHRRGPGEVKDGLEMVERVLRRFRIAELPGLPRFSGGAVGFIGYEFIHDIEPAVPRPPVNELQTPVLYFLITDQLLVFDRVAQTITILVNAVLDDASSPGEAYENAISEIDRLVSLLEEPAAHSAVTLAELETPLDLRSNISREAFGEKVEIVKRLIAAGDAIQVVGSQRFSMPVTATPFDIYRAARTINPSPYMFLLELDGFSLVGASPEIHVRSENRKVEIRPIAGTRPRGKTAELDAANERELLADPKERAEHVMLVDLARNDLGRVCDFGTVQLKDFMIVERYSHVMHIVSQVEGRLSAGKTVYDLMRSTFPAGTLSGAPKVRAMQIISELEQTERGPYGGCVGYFSFNGNLDCCITIRTALIKGGKAYVQAGGGWVNDSIPEDEYTETVNKAKAMLKAVALAEGMSRAR